MWIGGSTAQRNKLGVLTRGNRNVNNYCVRPGPVVRLYAETGQKGRCDQMQQVSSATVEKTVSFWTDSLSHPTASIIANL